MIALGQASRECLVSGPTDDTRAVPGGKDSSITVETIN